MSHPESTRPTLSADISEEAIEEALAAVEGRAGAAPDNAAVEIPVEAEAAPADGAGAEEEEVADPAAEIASLRAALEERDWLLEEAASRNQQMMQRLQEANDLRLRAVADLDNYKKRAAREREELQKFAIEKLLVELLPVLDNLDRALESARPEMPLEGFVEGVRMNRRLFEETLAKFGVQPFSAVGEEFDPRYHEAIQTVESHEHPANVVVRELVRGYRLHDRLVRPALVVVSSGPGPAAAEEPAAVEGAEADEARRAEEAGPGEQPAQD